MPLLPWKTTERRIGVLGPNWAGKTVFLTSLINHLSSHDPRYFHLGGGRASAEVRKFHRLKEDRDWPGFDYDQYRERLVHRRWPTKTADRAQYACQFERSDWTFSDLILKLYDLPGERINDVAMVKNGSDTFESWSDSFLRRIEKDIGYADRFEAYLKRLDDPNLSEADLLHSYKVALGRLRLAYKPYITPSTCPRPRRPGDPRPRSRGIGPGTLRRAQAGGGVRAAATLGAIEARSGRPPLRQPLRHLLRADR
jgi:hypothetical protein